MSVSAAAVHFSNRLIINCSEVSFLRSRSHTPFLRTRSHILSPEEDLTLRLCSHFYFLTTMKNRTQDENDCHFNQETVCYSEAGKINQEHIMPMPQHHCFPCRVFIYSATLAMTKEKFAIHFITLPVVSSPMQELLSTPLVCNARWLPSLWGGWAAVSCSLLSSQLWWSCFWDQSNWCIWGAAFAHPFIFGSCSIIWPLGSCFQFILLQTSLILSASCQMMPLLFAYSVPEFF